MTACHCNYADMLCHCGALLAEAATRYREEHPWRVYRVRDLGPKEHYRYQVEGYNFDRLDEFSWSVPSLENPKYDLSQAIWS